MQRSACYAVVKPLAPKAGCLLLADHARRVVKFLVFTFAFAQMASAVTVMYVTTNGTGQGTSWADPTNNLQGAIDVIEEGAANTVWVSNGVYQTGGVTNYPTGTILTNRVAIWKAITVRSANNDPTNTIIKGAWDVDSSHCGPTAVRCVYMTNGSSLIGFTLINGATFSNSPVTDNNNNLYGGGVWCQSNVSTTITISNCVITGNAAFWGGGAFYGTLYNCTISSNLLLIQTGQGAGTYLSTLYNCTIANNQAVSTGGGTFGGILYSCTVTGNTAYLGGGMEGGTAYNCLIVSNFAGHNGGGVRFGDLIYNCTIIGNTANKSAGGGAGLTDTLKVYNCLIANNSTIGNGAGAWDCNLYNCTIVSNSASYGGGVSTSRLYNCIVYFNTATTSGSNWYSSELKFTNSCTAPDPGGVGNTTSDPRFVDMGAGNYHLSANSPCVNTGTNGSWTTTYPTDLDGRQRIRYGTVDMGAYERINQGTIYGFH